MKDIIFLDLPVLGKIGTHPQFIHCKYAPAGYCFKRFPQLAFRYKWLSKNEHNRKIKEILCYRWHAIMKQIKILKEEAKKNGISTSFFYRYLSKFDIMLSQLNIPISDKLLFVPSIPNVLVETPWVVEIEDIVTLFYPFILNGQQGNIDVRSTEIFRMVKEVLRSNSCKGIITHIISTKESIGTLFNDPQISGKVTYIPMGHPAINKENVCKTYQKRLNSKINLLFTSSWGQQGFYNRGGMDAVYAFNKLLKKYPNIYLTIKCKIPDDLPEECRKLIFENEHIRIIEDKLEDQEMDALMSNTDIYLLPSARIHIVSILSAMGHGIPVITTDGWGISDYVQNRINGVIVPGRYGVNSFVDKDGMLRENYDSMYHKDEKICDGFADAISELIDNDNFRFSITKKAMEDYYSSFGLEQWNNALGKVFDNIYKKMEDEKNVSEPVVSLEDISGGIKNPDVRYEFFSWMISRVFYCYIMIRGHQFNLVAQKLLFRLKNKSIHLH